MLVKNLLGAPRIHSFCAVRIKAAPIRTFPCMEATYPYAIKNQEKEQILNTSSSVFMASDSWRRKSPDLTSTLSGDLWLSGCLHHPPGRAPHRPAGARLLSPPASEAVPGVLGGIQEEPGQVPG